MRQNKLAALLQIVIGRFLAEESSTWGIGKLVVVDRVLVTPDLRNAHVWLSFSPYNEKTAKREFEAVERHLREIQNFVFSQLTIRRVPRISLHASDTTHMFKIMEIFDTIKDHDSDAQPDQDDSTSSGQDSAGNS